MAPEMIEGLKEAMDLGVVCSNYTDPEYVWSQLKNFKGGTALFTQPNTPIKCGGAPQKIMYMAEEHFRNKKVRAKTNVIFATPGTVIFGVPEFAETLNKIIAERDIILKTYYAPIKIDGEKQEITFKYINSDIQEYAKNLNPSIGEKLHGDTELKLKYDMLHLAPPQQAPDFVRNSSVSLQDGPNKGWVDVDINTLRHNRFPNIFSLGDVAALPTAKTGAAIRKQAPVVSGNLYHLIKRGTLNYEIYEGYSSCPLVTGYSKMVLAEFKYNNIRDSDPLISKFVDTTKEQYSMWLLKKYGLPFMYWELMLKGRA
jgi:sulfide:quinone oxidoreductase